MPINVATLEALAATGATADMIIAVVKSELATDQATIDERRKNDAVRQRRKRAGHAMSRDVTRTPCDPSSSSSSPTPPITTPPPEEAAAVASARDPVVDAVDQVFAAIGVTDDPHWYGHKPRVVMWLESWSLEFDILPTVRRLMERRRDPPRRPAFFEEAIAEAHAQRQLPLPTVGPPAQRQFRAFSVIEQPRPRTPHDVIRDMLAEDGVTIGPVRTVGR